jgi:hypothetical protein
MRKKLFYLPAVLLALALCLQGCEKDGDANENGGDNNGGNPSIAFSVNVTGNITPENFVTGAAGTVTFSRFPASVNEWKQAQTQIGGTMPGAVALQIMASEMYRRNNTVGTECIKLGLVSSSHNSYTNLIRNVIGPRPYQFAAYLKGSSWDNGYNPTKPYTIEMFVTHTSISEYSNTYQANYFKFFVKSNGHDTNDGLQPVVVVKTAKPGEPGEGKYYIVEEASSIYLQCRERSFSANFNGLD